MLQRLTLIILCLSFFILLITGILNNNNIDDTNNPIVQKELFSPIDDNLVPDIASKEPSSTIEDNVSTEVKIEPTMPSKQMVVTENEQEEPTPPIEQKAVKKERLEILSSSPFKTLEWNDLIPEEDLNVLMNPPSYIDDLDDSAFNDDIDDQLDDILNSEVYIRYKEALASKKIIPDLNHKNVRIPGFVVPVEFDEESITEFFLVPYFGACIHSPPPPPNQIIYVHAPKGLQLDALYDPFWVSGKLSTSLVENYMATAAYSLQMTSYELYTED
jgi:hypothetical protein